MSKAGKSRNRSVEEPLQVASRDPRPRVGRSGFRSRLEQGNLRRAGGALPFYCDPVQFFATSYATANLRDFCRAVLRRLAGEKGGEAIINVSQTFGGGKSHTLATLYYFTTLGEKLPRGDNTVEQILNNAQLGDAPAARLAAVSFDHVDWKDGGRAKSPGGEVRRFRMPWNLVAWQLLGTRGLEIINREETQSGYDTPRQTSFGLNFGTPQETENYVR